MSGHYRQRLILDDGGERIGLETGAADESAIDLSLAEESGRVVWLDTAAVEDAHGVGNVGAEELGDFSADDIVRVRSHLGRGGFAGADGPDRLVGGGDGGGGFRRDFGET